MMNLHVLGTGGPRPNARATRYGTSCILDLGSECIMLDCGPAGTHKMARMDLCPTQVVIAFEIDWACCEMPGTRDNNHENVPIA